MAVVITIEPSGAAFEEDAAREVARIINRAQGKVVDGRVGPGDSAPLLDHNGNTCGQIVWTDDEAGD